MGNCLKNVGRQTALAINAVGETGRSIGCGAYLARMSGVRCPVGPLRKGPFHGRF
jgi:hypothetical protein